MPTTPNRMRIYPTPHAAHLFDSYIEALREEHGKRGTDIVLDLQVFEQTTTPELMVVDGAPLEVLHGVRRPMRLRFTDATALRRTGPYTDFDALPPEDSARHLFGILHARQRTVGEFYWLTTGAIVSGELTLSARACLLEPRQGPSTPRTVERRWAPTPPSPAGLVPHPRMLHQRYGGDPIRVNLGERMLLNRLFIGGLHHQSEARPGIDHVLNLCGVENPWCAAQGQHPDDRFAHKGEMADGMDADDILAEAGWVAERLRAGKRVLVHCYAGINRSSTVCCAALMLLEGLSAEAALARVRERHPSAWPDPYHWFLLRWLAQSLGAMSAAQRRARWAPAQPEPIATAIN